MAKKGTKTGVRGADEELVLKLAEMSKLNAAAFSFFVSVHGRLVSPCPSGADRKKANDEVRG
jgi:hypothetical protein